MDPSGAINVTYYYSACVRSETAELSILCDPWFSEGAYDGSWYHYPPFDNPIANIPACDFVYVSHIHPDHYDPEFLRDYTGAHPAARVIVADFQNNFLSGKMRSDGIAHDVVMELNVGQTFLSLVPNEDSSYDVDSALVVKRGGHSVVNMNDNLFNPNQIERILEITAGPPTIALLGYTGAGPYPQTYYSDPSVMVSEAKKKKQRFFERYRTLRDALDPSLVIPFAGKYVLGGKLHSLNPYRGVADACEVLAFDDRAVVLADAGFGSVDTETLQPTKVRTKPYDVAKVREYVANLANRPMDYEVYFQDLPRSRMPLERLLPLAFENAHRRSVVESDYYFCIDLGDHWFAGNANRKDGECEFIEDVTSLGPRSEITIDPRYLFGLVTGVFHWNNAEVGSQYQTRRVPDVFDRDAQAFLNFLHV